MKTQPNSKLSKKVYSFDNLSKAWDYVYIKSKKGSKKTRSEAEIFKQNELKNLRSISVRLKKKTFRFSGVKGFSPKAKGKSKGRPLAIIPPESRVVHRSILDVLQKHKAIKKYLNVETSFGGIKEKGVPEAIERAKEAIKKGAKYYIKSDIKEFFTKVPLPLVLKTLEKDIDDNQLIDLIDKALRLEVQVMSGFEDQKDFFDYEEKGTPQGCCLSPLMSNILLYDFDNLMNQDDVTCLRYLDDFIIFASSEKIANQAFSKAKKTLEPYNLDVYEPGIHKDKASKGHTKSKFEYLGVEFDGDKRRPSQKNRTEILRKVKEKIEESKSIVKIVKEKDFFDYSKIYNEGSYTQTMIGIQNILNGWGKQFKDCNDKTVMGSLDKDIGDMLKDYKKFINIEAQALIKKGKYASKMAARIQGVYLLIDSNPPDKQKNKEPKK